LFTDIVGSTDRAHQLGDRRWRYLLEDHHAHVRRLLKRFRGVEIDTAGDGFFATFDGPARAIRCACAIRDAVADLGIEIRAGLHTGEVERRGGEVTGLAVHVGARVAALADASEVLVTGTVQMLVLGSGIGFADRGKPHAQGSSRPVAPVRGGARLTGSRAPNGAHEDPRRRAGAECARDSAGSAHRRRLRAGLPPGRPARQRAALRAGYPQLTITADRCGSTRPGRAQQRRHWDFFTAPSVIS
jgi:hypothetical protein